MHHPIHAAPALHVSVGLDVGRARAGKPNQDSVGVYSEYCHDDERIAANGRLFAVADGMGGAAGGQQASCLAVEALMNAYYGTPASDIGAQLIDAVQSANVQIYQQGQADPALKGMGTTIVAAVLHGDQATVANAGDSRAYLLRDGLLSQISVDHSLVQEQVRQGMLTAEQAAHHPKRNVILRNLGYAPRAEPDLCNVALQDGDALVLCSDGVWGVLEDDMIAQIAGQETDAAQALVDAANAAGGPDNIGVVIVRIKQLQPQASERITQRITEYDDTV